MNIAFRSKKDEQNRNGSQPQKNITTAPFDDGYQWRKYGEKKIRGKAFPRCYYRCTYREDKGCGATKQVQQQCRSDPPLFLVTRKGEHTCDKAPPTSTPGHGYMVRSHRQPIQEFSLSMAADGPYCGDHCTLIHPAFMSYSSPNSTVESHYPTNDQLFYEEDGSVLDESALGSTPADACDSNFSDGSFRETSQTFGVSDLKLEEFDLDELCAFVLW